MIRDSAASMPVPATDAARLQIMVAGRGGLAGGAARSQSGWVTDVGLPERVVHSVNLRRQTGALRWEGVPEHVYKEDGASFRGVTRRVLFDAEHGQRVQVRYFEVAPGGWTTLERHGHTHQVIVLRGRGEVLVGDQVVEVAEHDLVFVPPHAWHQFQARGDEPFGFQCVVTAERDRPHRPDAAELAALRADPEIAAFIRA